MASTILQNASDFLHDGSNLHLADRNNSLLSHNNTTLHLNETVGSPGSTSQAESLASIYQGFDITFYSLFPVLFIVGMFGNLITITIMSRNNLTSMASKYILIMLSICDITMIMMHTFNKKSMVRLVGFDIRVMSVFGCKAFFLVYRTVKCMSSWLIVLLCVERFITVVFPFKVKMIITRKRVVTLILGIFLMLAIFNSIWTFAVDIVQSKEKTECKQNVKSNANEAFYDVCLALFNAIFSWIPLCIMSTLTPIIVFKIIQQMKKKDAISSATNTGTETIRISAMLIGVVIAYAVFILPVTLTHINKTYYNFGMQKEGTEFLTFKEVAQYLEMMNFSTNFIMYTLGFVKYREKVKSLMCRCFWKAGEQQNPYHYRNTTNGTN